MTDRDYPASHRFWERCILETLKEGGESQPRSSVFDGELELAKRFLDALPDGGDVLDFGCGLGRNALALAERGYRVLVCDVVDAAVRYCEERAYGQGYQELRSVGYDGREIELANGSVDGVLAWSCLDHVTLPHAEELAGELGRIARPGAALLISFDEDRSDDPDSEGRLLEDGTFEYTAGRREGMLFRPYTNGEIRDLFEEDWELVGWSGDDMTVARRALYSRR